MNAPDGNDMEARLRAALAAKAEQVTPDSLDHDRQEEFAARLAAAPTDSGQRRGRNVFLGAGLLAAAAAAAGVFVLSQNSERTHTVDAVAPVTITTTTTPRAGTTGGAQSSTDGTSTVTTTVTRSATGPAAGTNGSATSTAAPSTTAGTAQGEAGSAGPTSVTTTATPSTTASASPSATATERSTAGGQARRYSAALATANPPIMPSSYPQANGVESGVTYSGSLPLYVTTDGETVTRMVQLPSSVTWELTSSGSYRITAGASEVDTYWAGTLGQYGWVKSGTGWVIPGTGYAVQLPDTEGVVTTSVPGS